ncbi:MAG: hypothetical protein ACOCXX_05010 [Planctomycetota bacterium]
MKLSMGRKARSEHADVHACPNCLNETNIRSYCARCDKEGCPACMPKMCNKCSTNAAMLWTGISVAVVFLVVLYIILQLAGD